MVRNFWHRRLARRRFLKESAAAGLLLSLPRDRIEAVAPPPNHLYWVQNIPDNPYTSASHPNDHVGVNALLELMARHNRKFYLSATTGPLAGPEGLIAANDVVLIKVNAQWKYRGCTNSDVIRGLIQKILDHPDGFSGEVVIFENGQGWGNLNCEVFNPEYYPDATQHANANNESHSFQYLVDTVFAGRPVSAILLDDCRFTLVDFGDHTTNGYRLLDESVEDVSYPCFTTAGGHRVELQEGLWTGTGHTHQNLKLINVPVLKDHFYTNLTCSLKNTYGILSMGDGEAFSVRHPVDPSGYGRIWGKMMATVKTSVLNIVDAIWVSKGDYTVFPSPGLSGYPPEITRRANQLLAGQDPVALDYWAAKYILHPISNLPLHLPDNMKVNAWLTSAQDTINGRGVYDPDNCIYIRYVTKNEAYMAVHTVNLAGRSVPPIVNLLLED